MVALPSPAMPRMKAIVCTTLGGPELLQLQELPTVVLRANELRVAVASAGVNFPDSLQIAGIYQMKLNPPFTPGCEVAGLVTEVGSKVTRFKQGDAVASYVPFGGYASECVVQAEAAMPLPAALDLKDAGGFPLVYGTTIHALKQRGQLKAGETLLVLGAAGGVGLAAVQLGKLMGAKVIAAASSAEKLALCTAHGADAVINYSTESLKDAIKTLTKGLGADVIYDPVGGALGEECLSCIAWNGRYLVIGFAAGPIPSLAANRLLLKGAAAVGVFWGAFTVREPLVNAENFAQLFEWIAAGSLKPYVSKRYALADAGLALRDMMERKVTGKIVLTP